MFGGTFTDGGKTGTNRFGETTGRKNGDWRKYVILGRYC